MKHCYTSLYVCIKQKSVFKVLGEKSKLGLYCCLE